MAVPILNEALAALDTIKEADINYIKKLGNPPGAIKLVLEAICVILDAKPAKAKDEAGRTVNDYWKPSVGLLNEKDFLKNLKSYDKVRGSYGGERRGKDAIGGREWWGKGMG